MQSVLDVADYIIWYCQRAGYKLSNFRLQMVLYFAQAYFLMEEEKPCFSEDIEAWPCGPVVPVVYEMHKEQSTLFSKFSLNNTPLTERERDICALTVEALFDYTEGQLFSMTTRSEPYKTACLHGDKTVITKDSIKKAVRDFRV